MSAQRDCIHGRLARSCELCAAQNDHATACEQIDRLRAENERLRADAERYRWLRGDQCDIVVGTNPGAMDYGMSCVSGTYEDWLGGDELDAAIDAAMREDGE